MICGAHTETKAQRASRPCQHKTGAHQTPSSIHRRRVLTAASKPPSTEVAAKPLSITKQQLHIHPSIQVSLHRAPLVSHRTSSMSHPNHHSTHCTASATAETLVSPGRGRKRQTPLSDVDNGNSASDGHPTVVTSSVPNVMDFPASPTSKRVHGSVKVGPGSPTTRGRQRSPGRGSPRSPGGRRQRSPSSHSKSAARPKSPSTAAPNVKLTATATPMPTSPSQLPAHIRSRLKTSISHPLTISWLLTSDMVVAPEVTRRRSSLRSSDPGPAVVGSTTLISTSTHSNTGDNDVEENGLQGGGFRVIASEHGREDDFDPALAEFLDRDAPKACGNLALCSVPGKKVRLDGVGMSGSRSPVHR